MGTGAPDPRGAREVVAAFSEALRTVSRTPEELAAAEHARAAGGKRTRGKANLDDPSPPPPPIRRVPETKFGLAMGPCRILQRGSLQGLDTPDGPEDCDQTLDLARLSSAPTAVFLMEYFIGRYVTSITALEWAVYLTSLTADEYDGMYPLGKPLDQAYLGRPQFRAIHPSRYEPHVGAGTIEEYVMGVRAGQPVDLRRCLLIPGLAGYTNAAQLALSLMGFSRDNGGADPDVNAIEEVMGLARAIPEALRMPGAVWDTLPPVRRCPEPLLTSLPRNRPSPRAPPRQAPEDVEMLPGYQDVVFPLARVGFDAAIGRRVRSAGALA